MVVHKIQGFGKEDICRIFNDKGRFYLNESIKDEQDAIDFYSRVMERMTNVLDEEDRIRIEHIILDEKEHKEMFQEINKKLDDFCGV